ncbi:MAG: DUF2130 domain-containing protein [Planctomycetota bacterium]
MSKAISCPNCRTEIEISEVLKTQLTEEIRADFESKLGSKRAELESAQKELAEQSKAIEAQRQSLADQVKDGIEAERSKLLEVAKKEVADAMKLEMKDREQQLDELRTKLQSAQANELALRKKERELEAKTEELQLTVARQLDAEREKIRETAMKQFADEHQLKDAEKQKMISDMRRQIDDLKRKAEQGSMQTQGEVQELALEEMLELAFPHDSIEAVGKGVNGADSTQRVFCPFGTECGSILWESKRTKSFSKAWLPKLRDDQRAVRASVTVLVTQAMPEGVDTFAQIDGVWVCSWKCAKALATVLRSGLIEVGKSKLASQGQAEKMELVYNYLSSSEFQQRVDGVVEAFEGMQSDLESERRSMKRIWSKREKQIDRALSNTAGLYGDLQGIIGASLPAVEGLSMPLIECDSEAQASVNAA